MSYFSRVWDGQRFHEGYALIRLYTTEESRVKRKMHTSNIVSNVQYCTVLVKYFIERRDIEAPTKWHLVALDRLTYLVISRALSYISRDLCHDEVCR